MKIRVTYEKIFDSDKCFEKDYSFTKNEFEQIICEQITEWVDLSEDQWKFEELKDDSK